MSPIPHLFKIRGVLRWSWKPNVTSVKRTSSNEFGIPIGITGTHLDGPFYSSTQHIHMDRLRKRRWNLNQHIFFFCFITFQKIVKLEPFIVFEHDSHSPSTDTFNWYFTELSCYLPNNPHSFFFSIDFMSPSLCMP